MLKLWAFAPAADKCFTLWIMSERTFAMIKPDGVKRGLTAEILRRIEHKGYRVVGLKLYQIPREVAENHYGEHSDKPFFGELVDFITSGPVVAIALEGENAIAGWRSMMGATNPANAAPGTIRGDFATSMGENVSHGSDSPESAERELALFFSDSELIK
ncbi:nucleoside-diphosphate kinase [Deinococcus radiophilus]|uniref:Nucleoside diphosphate kinase n=2 Tax=Deinococcus radiophilus TaxID=32062 RepID=A0A3S0LAN7_9DEIO|nr:nucleoside-diphosphate kinase [Deinococcus radiophilus]